MTDAERAELQAAMARLAAGDRPAFDVVYARLWPLVKAACYRFLEQPADAEDAAQNALIKLFDQASRFDPSRSAVGWALAVAAWEARTLRRKRGRLREAGPAVLDFMEAGGDVAEQAALREQIEQVDALLAELSPMDQEAVRASLTGETPPGATYRKRKQRAFDRLLAAWSERHG